LPWLSLAVVALVRGAFLGRGGGWRGRLGACGARGGPGLRCLRRGCASVGSGCLCRVRPAAGFSLRPLVFRLSIAPGRPPAGIKRAVLARQRRTAAAAAPPPPCGVEHY